MNGFTFGVGGFDPLGSAARRFGPQFGGFVGPGFLPGPGSRTTAEIIAEILRGIVVRPPTLPPRIGPRTFPGGPAPSPPERPPEPFPFPEPEDVLEVVIPQPPKPPLEPPPSAAKIILEGLSKVAQVVLPSTTEALGVLIHDIITPEPKAPAPVIVVRPPVPVPPAPEPPVAPPATEPPVEISMEEEPMPNGIGDFLGRLGTSLGDVAITGLEQISAEILEGLVDKGKQELLQLVGLAEPPAAAVTGQVAGRDLTAILEALGGGGLPEVLRGAAAKGVGPGGSELISTFADLLGFGDGGAITRGDGGGAIARGIRLASEPGGMFHTTAVRTRFDPKTGAPRQVGGNRAANTLTLVQDPTTRRMEFFVHAGKPTHFSKLGKFPRARSSPTRKARSRRRTPKGDGRGHGVHLTKKQIRAGFGGKRAQIAARSG